MHAWLKDLGREFAATFSAIPITLPWYVTYVAIFGPLPPPGETNGTISEICFWLSVVGAAASIVWLRDKILRRWRSYSR